MRRIYLVVPFLLAGCLSYEKFQDKYADKDCDEGLKCAAAYPCDFDPADDLPTEEDCDFDRKAAKQCLDNAWVCNTSFPGFEYAVPPTACEAVCTTLETGPVVTDGTNI